MITKHEHELGGCRPAPLACYLKALGVLRLVSEQADRQARGYWRNDRFVLVTVLDREALERYFLEDYQPTPLVGPWGARSGFYPGASESSARAALEAIADSTVMRLDVFRQAIRDVRDLLKRHGFAEKDDVKDRKDELMLLCRNALADEVVRWLDACYVISAEGTGFPPLFGSGGNEGSGSYMSGFASQVVACVLERGYDRALSAALWDSAVDRSQTAQTPGHFLPSAAEGDAALNPWDYLLCLEGALLFASSVVRRSEEERGMAAFPFTVQALAAGYGSAGSEKTRGEIWMPLWEQPASLAELSALFSEGRAELGKRRVRSSVEFARAVATLGVDRGLTGFVRYGFLERNGLSNFAVPLGRLAVRERPLVRLLDEVAGWSERLRQKLAGKGAPASVMRSLRRLEDAVFVLCEDDSTPRLMQVFLALGDCERALVRSLQWARKAGMEPAPRLSRGWLDALMRENSVELRLAAALASVSAGTPGRLPLTEQIEPIEPKGRRLAWAESPGREVVWPASESGGDVVGALLDVLHRRILLAEQHTRTFSDQGRVAATWEDIAAFIQGNMDDRHLCELAWACALIDWKWVAAAGTGHPWQKSEMRPGMDYALLKLCFAGHPVGHIEVPMVPRIVRLASAGQGEEACRAAVQRLRASGLAPMVRGIGAAGELARRTAAALVFPLSQQQVNDLARQVIRPSELRHEDHDREQELAIEENA